MVFLIQNTQNRGARAIQLKLDELIRAVQGARTGRVRLEELSDEELSRVALAVVRFRARSKGQQRLADSGPSSRPIETKRPKRGTRSDGTR